MESGDLQPASSPWRLRKQEDGQAAEQQKEEEEGDQEQNQNQNQQVVSKDSNSSENVEVIEGTNEGVLVSKVMFDAPQQYVQAARLIGRSEFTDKGGSSVACQFEAEGDGVGPMFGFGEEVYPDVLVDGIECLAYISDREDDGDDELSMTDDDDDLGNVVSDSGVVDDDEDIVEGYPFTVFLDSFFDDENDNGDDIEDDTEDDEMFQFPDDSSSSEDLPRTLSEDSSDGNGRDVWSPWGRNRYTAESRGRNINSRGSGWSPWSSNEASSALPEDDEEEIEFISGGGGGGAGGGAGSEVSDNGRYTDEDEYIQGNEEVADGDLSWLDAGNEETETGD